MSTKPGAVPFGDYAGRWLAARNGAMTTAARDRSIMRTHILPRWGRTPLTRIDHLSVQGWVTELGERLAPATVAECFRLTSGVLRSAARDRLIGVNPCDGVRLPRRRKKDGDDLTITPAVLTGQLLPVVPDRYRALVALAGGTGLRWGECIGLRWSAVELDQAVAHVVRVASGGLCFHDLRHSYATWLISRGVPANDVQKVMGHERASTTLDRYTHGSGAHEKRVLGAFADDPLTFEEKRGPENGGEPSEEGS